MIFYRNTCVTWSIALIWISCSSQAASTSQIDEQHNEQRFNQSHRSANAIQYSRKTLTELYNEMDDLASTYPTFATVKSTQDEFDLPSTCRDFESQHVGCYNRYLVIEDPLIYSKNIAAKARKQRPDVFLSGALHGDERVGPVAMVEVAKLLVLAASCESNDAQSNDCDVFYSKYTREQAAWLARLVSTRRIVVFPAPNAKGYYSNSRFERYANSAGSYSSLDPNRDFSFDNSPSQCMRSITARSVNELFLQYLFQMSMTYHGGIENITFEWGALSIPNGKVSPDDAAQRMIAEKMAYFAGELYPSYSNDQFYENGDMNSILYGVYGGFEDWVYAGSWKTDMTVQCTPSTYGGYDRSKTVYDDATLNTFNFLVEISNSKNPPSIQYGSETNLLNAPYEYDNHVNNGYVTKHVRTALMAIDTVEPYVEIKSVKKKSFTSELKPLRKLGNRWCRKFKKINHKRGRPAKVTWTVGGSFTVNETFLIYGLWSDFPPQFNCINQVSHEDITAILNDTSGKFYRTTTQSGVTKWADPMSGTNPTFKAWPRVPSEALRKDKFAVFAVAVVDQDWVNQPNNAWPTNTDVQSHVVNIRTNPNYLKTKGTEREVEGRLYWISIPVTITAK